MFTSTNQVGDYMMHNAISPIQNKFIGYFVEVKSITGLCKMQAVFSDLDKDKIRRYVIQGAT